MCFNDEEYINPVIRAPIYTLTKKTAFSEPTASKLSPARSGWARPARSGDFTPKLNSLPGPIGRDGPIPSGESALQSLLMMLRARSGEDARLVVRSSARSGEMAQCHRAKPRSHKTAQFLQLVAGPIGRTPDYLIWRISSTQPFSTPQYTFMSFICSHIPNNLPLGDRCKWRKLNTFIIFSFISTPNPPSSPSINEDQLRSCTTLVYHNSHS